VIVAPYEVHDASVADFAPGHSLAQTLAEADAGSGALTFWKSATAATSVAVRVEPGRHLSLFMGQRTLGGELAGRP